MGSFYKEHWVIFSFLLTELHYFIDATFSIVLAELHPTFCAIGFVCLSLPFLELSANAYTSDIYVFATVSLGPYA